MERTTILVVDDEPVVRRVISYVLSQAGYQVETFVDAQTALERLRHPGVDLLLLDLQLGNDSGLDVMKSARQIWPQLPIIIITAHGSLPSAIEAVRYDAADYLLKPVHKEVLCGRIAEVLARARARRAHEERIRAMYTHLQAFFQDECQPGLAPPDAVAGGPLAYSAGPLLMDVKQHRVQMHGQPVDLTPTEFSLLHELVRQRGMVVTCQQLVYAFQNVLIDEEEARHVIRPHITRLRRKIEPDPQRPTYIQSVRGIGYRWEDPDPAP